MTDQTQIAIEMQPNDTNNTPPSPPASDISSPVLNDGKDNIMQLNEMNIHDSPQMEESVVQMSVDQLSPRQTPRIKTRDTTADESSIKQDNESSLDFDITLGETKQEITDERDRRLLNVLKINPDHFNATIFSPDELSLQQFINDAPSVASEHQYVASYWIEPDVRISCVNWKGRWFISGTDIVRVLLHRYMLYVGRKPFNMKKFEEGIFSDLRRLSPPKDCVLENTRSDFLIFLFDYDCVRSKKKQKVFFWSSFKNCADNLFCDALDRELARVEMAKAVGMSIDEFVKSGVVPTGSSSQSEMNRRPLPFDWTLVASQRVDCGDNDGPSLKPMLSVDQIHFIRNDINSLFQKYLRSVLRCRSEQVTEPELSKADQVCQFKTHKGEPVAQPTPVKKTTPRKPRQQQLESFDSTSETENDEYVRAPVSRRARAVQKPKSFSSSPPATPKSTPRAARFSAQSPAVRSMPGTPVKGVKTSPIARSSTPANLRFTPYGYRRSPFPFPPRLPLLSQDTDDQEDNESVSTMSSNEEEVQEVYSKLQKMSGSELFHMASSPVAQSLVHSPVSPVMQNTADQILDIPMQDSSQEKKGNDYEAAFILLQMNQN